MMSKRILVIEPYDAIAGVIVDLLEDLDYTADVVNSGGLENVNLDTHLYYCVLINVDQNRDEWRNSGLRLAAVLSKAGLPVVMIPDHETAATTVKANGWVGLAKPFTIGGLQNAISDAVRAAAQ